MKTNKKLIDVENTEAKDRWFVSHIFWKKSRAEKWIKILDNS